MKLTEHFDVAEFEHEAPIPQNCLAIFKALCADILEPIRGFVGVPVEITSGYRTRLINAQEPHGMIHGAPNSEHVATPMFCAADFIFVNPVISYRNCFDWIRKNPSLPFHQVILEHGQLGSNIIHISINMNLMGERQALEGAEYNASPYSTFDVVPFVQPKTQGG